MSPDVTSDLTSSYQDYVDQIPVDKQTKLKCDIQSDEHISRLARHMIGWEEKHYLFNLKYNPDVHDINDGQYKDKPGMKR